RGTLDLSGTGQRVPLVGLTELRVVACVLERVVDDVGIERARPRVALAMIGDHANADAFDHRGRQRLDLTAEDLHLGLARPHDVGLDLLVRTRGARDATCDVEELAHAAVPPTVISRTSTVGWPDETGTLWPFLPHMPVHVSKSLPTASI